MSSAELANLFGIKREQISGWLQNHGLKRDGTGKQNKIFSESDIEFIKENYLDMSYSEIGNILGFTDRQIRGKIANLKLPRKNRIINSSYFHDIDNPLKAYFLGFIYADGWVVFNESQRNYEFGFSLQSCDKYILDKLNEELGGNNLIVKKDAKDKVYNDVPFRSKECYVLRVFSKELVSDLISNGVVENKTKKDVYPIVPDDLFFDFMRGYIDGDGCYYQCKGNTYMHITSASIESLKYFQNKLLEFDIETRIYTEKEHKHRLMCVNLENMNRLINRLYYEGGLFCLERKYEKIKHFLSLAA